MDTAISPAGRNYPETFQTLQYASRAKDIKVRPVTHEETSVVRASDESFQVKWTERTWEGGSLAKTERWTGILSIVIRQPREVATLRKNPLGIYVHGLDWSRELNPGESP